MQGTQTPQIRPDRVAVYIRWSTEDQGDGTTLAVQREGCEHYLLSQGWQVNPDLLFIDDGYSGGSLDRPRLQALRGAVKAGAVDCVVVYKLDRLSRSVLDTVNLVLDEWESRTYLKSAREPIDTTTPMGKQFFYMLVSYAEWERGVIRDRTHSGKLRRAREGRYWGGTVPYGYRLSGEPGVLAVDPDQAGVVGTVFRQYLTHGSLARIARGLNQDGIPGPGGGAWSRVSLRRLLGNPIYAGQVRYAKQRVNPRHQRDRTEPRLLPNATPVEAPSQFPALISPDEFARAQELLADRRAPTAGGRALAGEHLLTGLLRCACGSPMVAHRIGKRYAYYMCAGKSRSGDGACRAGQIPEAELDKAVEQALSHLLRSSEALDHVMALQEDAVAAHLKDIRDQRRESAQRAEKLMEQARRLNRLLRSGDLSAARYEENRREVDAELAQVRDRAARLERLEDALVSQQAVADLEQRWAEMDVPERKAVLRLLVREMVANRPRRRPEVSLRVVWRFGTAPG